MGSKINASDLLKTAKVVFWDFDGVIKESVDVKTKAFQKLFVEYGTEVTEKIRLHHEANGGMSRFEKFPIYMEFANVRVTEEKVNRLSEKFGDLVLEGVVNSPWIPGSETFIRSNPNQQVFIVVSATPTEELLIILNRLNLKSSFESIFGAPISKSEAIKASLLRLSISAADSVMIGDASADLEAASFNKVPFILRRHHSNAKLAELFSGITINDLSEI
jgi:phosphoglycolate phosphatase-like HAD superfamily hydrolase